MRSRYVLWAFILCNVLVLCVCLVMSVNVHERPYPELIKRINKLKSQSVMLNNAMLYVNGSLRADFDELALRENEFRTTYEHLGGAMSFEGTRVLEQVAQLRGNNVNQLPAPADEIDALVSARLDSIDAFKTHIVIARNSEMIALQLVTDLYESHRNSSVLSVPYLELSNIIHSAVRSDIRAIGPQTIQRIREVRNIDSAAEDGRSLVLLERHIELLSEHGLIVADQVAIEARLKERLEAELNSYARILGEVYSKADQKSTVFRRMVLLMVLLLTLSVSLLVSLNHRLSSRLRRYSSELESKVELRTQELSREKDSLLTEQQRGEMLIRRLEQSEKKMVALVNSVHCCIVDFCVETGEVRYISRGVQRLWNKDSADIQSIEQLREAIHEDDRAGVEAMVGQVRSGSLSANARYRIVAPDGSQVWVREDCSIQEGDSGSIVSVIVDVTEAKIASDESERMLQELADAAKMESVGMLAAGIAHEINTPAQFVSDNLRFLKESWSEMLLLIDGLREATESVGNAQLNDRVSTLCESADLDYLVEECEPALQQSSEGVASIARIVRAMKEHSHPSTEVESVDLNHVIENTITVSKGEWKNFASVETDFEADLPSFNCIAGDISQVVLNMIVNSSHALSERSVAGDEEPNTITLTTVSDDDEVRITVRDNGPGMPEEVRARVFEHFFTTKEVGKGTGQGLSLAHRVIVDTYGGSIDVWSEMNVGTAFTIHLPRKEVERACA